MKRFLGIFASVSLLASDIPTLSLNDFLKEDSRVEFAHRFGEALENDGIVAITDSDITEEDIAKMVDLCKRYFALPYEEKIVAFTNNGLQGYVPYLGEHAKGYKLGDLKEYYHVRGRHVPSHLWPTSMPEFKVETLALYDRFTNIIHYLLEAIAIHLGLEDEKLFSNLIEEDTSILRLLYYPPVDEENAKLGAVRSQQHEDINLLTIMPKASAPGLQIKTRQGEWIDVTVPDGSIIVTPSEVLGHLTQKRIKATTHRVINPIEGDRSERYSLPYFSSPPDDALLPIINKEGQIESYILHSDLYYKRMQETGFTP